LITFQFYAICMKCCYDLSLEIFRWDLSLGDESLCPKAVSA